MKSKTIQQSEKARGIAIGWFAENGYIVSIPLTHHMDYDILVDKEGIKKVRVCSTSCKNSYGRWEVSLREMCSPYSGGNVIKKFDNSKYDLIFMVCGEGKGKELFLFPSADISVTTKITPENYPTYRIN